MNPHGTESRVCNTTLLHKGLNSHLPFLHRSAEDGDTSTEPQIHQEPL